MDRRTDTIEVVSNLFNLAMNIQNNYLKGSQFPELSMTEMHVIEAVSLEQIPTMSNVAKRLKVTVGTLTTSVKKIEEKGFLKREQSTVDHRMMFLRITDKGYQALEVHNQFHRELSQIYKARIPEERIDWVFDTLQAIYNDLLDYQKNIK